MHKMSSSSPPLREFGPLTQLLVSVPRQVQRGLLTYNITWTCVDVTESWIVIGTDAGLVYLYSRLHGRVEHQLTVSQSGSEPVVRVKMKESIDHVIACSTTSGLICIFQLPVLIHTPSFPNLKSYVVSGLHHSAVVCMEWSINGMRLFSGDRDGVIVCTNVDYTIEQCTSYVLCKEPHAIVQLCYAHRVLLVSTHQRSAVCHVENPNELQQIGKQERKIPGPFGATFIPGSLCSADAGIYASRPGLRLWKADINGIVSTTITFPKPSESCLRSSSEAEKSLEEPPLQFGVLFPYPGGMLLSRSPSGILLLDPNGIGNIERIFPAVGVLDVALNGEEVFILRRSAGPHSRPLIRLAPHPEDIYMRSMLTSMMEIPSSGVSSSKSKHDKSVYQTAGQLTGKVFRALLHIGGRLTAVEEGTISTARGCDPSSSELSAEIAEDACLQMEDNLTFPSSESTTLESIPAVRLLPADIPPIRIVEARPENAFHTSADGLNCWTFDRNSVENADGIRIRRSSATLLRTTAAESDALTVLRSHSVGADDMARSWSSYGDDGATGFQFGGTGDNNDDIVFSSSLGKKKVKKVRPRSKGTISKDTISISSVESSDSDRLLNSWDNNMAAANARPQVHESRNTVTAGIPPNLPTFSSISNPTAVCSIQSQSPHSCSVSPETFSLTARKNSSPLLYPVDEPSEIRSRNLSGSESASPPQIGVTNDHKRRNNSDTVGRENVLCSCSTPPSRSTFDVFCTAGNTGSTSVNVPTSKTVDKLCLSHPAASGGDADLFKIDGSSHEIQSSSRPPSCPVELASSPVTSIYKTSTNCCESEILGESVTTAGSVQGSMPDFTPVVPRSVSATVTSPSDDFQSIYSSYGNNESPSSPAGKKNDPSSPSPPLESTVSASPSRVGNADTWVEFPTPLGNSALSSLSVSRHTVWCTDRSERAFHSTLAGPGLRWTALDQPASQISTSPSGHIVWRIHRGSAFAAGGKLTAKSPVTPEWREVVARDVAFVAVDDHTVWYVKVNGEVKVQKDLGRERTSYRSLSVPCDECIVLVACRGNIVWAVTENRHALVRIGVEKGIEQGTGWQPLDGFGATLSISSVDIDVDYGVVWISEMSGRFWFTTGVNSVTPTGCGHWWQVSTSGFLIAEQSSPRRQPVRALIDLPSKIISTQSSAADGGLVAVGVAGKAVWTCLGTSPVLHVCRSSIIGHRWHVTMPSGLPSFTRWRHLSATCLHDPVSHTHFDVVWLQQPNGSIFCLSSSADGEIRRFLEIPAPPTASDSAVTTAVLPFVTFCATSDALWGLTDDGRLFVRDGIAVHCLTGLNWVMIDLTQLGRNKLVHIAVTSRYLWAIDAIGSVYHRSASLPVPGRRQTATWQRLPADDTQQQLSRSIWGSATMSFGNTASDPFVSIYAGPSDWMVWAVDSRQNIFVREGISEDCPSGTTWSRVSGLQADSLCISESTVYVVAPRGLCFVRHGITPEVPHGEYWKQIPGDDFAVLSVTAQDSLWALDRDGQLHRWQVFVLERTPTNSPIKATEDDWEMI